MTRLSSLLGIIVLTFSLTVPKKSQAAAGLITSIAGAPVGLVIAGIGAASLTLGGISLALPVRPSDENINPDGLRKLGAAILFGGLGILLLDGDEAVTVEYQRLSPEMAAKAGLNKGECKAFNQALENYNAVNEQIHEDLAAKYGDQTVDLNQLKADADFLWSEYATAFSPTEALAIKKYRAFLSQAKLN